MPVSPFSNLHNLLSKYFFYMGRFCRSPQFLAGLSHLILFMGFANLTSSPKTFCPCKGLEREKNSVICFMSGFGDVQMPGESFLLFLSVVLPKISRRWLAIPFLQVLCANQRTWKRGQSCTSYPGQRERLLLPPCSLQDVDNDRQSWHLFLCTGLGSFLCTGGEGVGLGREEYRCSSIARGKIFILFILWPLLLRISCHDYDYLSASPTAQGYHEDKRSGEAIHATLSILEEWCIQCEK